VHFRQLARMLSRHTWLYTEMVVDQTVVHQSHNLVCPRTTVQKHAVPRPTVPPSSVCCLTSLLFFFRSSVLWRPPDPLCFPSRALSHGIVSLVFPIPGGKDSLHS